MYLFGQNQPQYSYQNWPCGIISIIIRALVHFRDPNFNLSSTSIWISNAIGSKNSKCREHAMRSGNGWCYCQDKFLKCSMLKIQQFNRHLAFQLRQSLASHRPANKLFTNWNFFSEFKLFMSRKRDQLIKTKQHTICTEIQSGLKLICIVVVPSLLCRHSITECAGARPVTCWRTKLCEGIPPPTTPFGPQVPPG